MKLKAQENHRYNIWLEEATRDPDKKLILFGKERTVKEVRVLVDASLGGALLLLLILFLISSNTIASGGALEVLINISKIFLFVLFAVLLFFEIHCANKLKALFRSENTVRQQVVENEEFQESVKRKMQSEFAEKATRRNSKFLPGKRR